MKTYNATNSLASDPNRGNQLNPQNYQTDVLSLLKDLLPLVIRPHLLVPRDITSPLTQGTFHTIQISIRVCWTSAKTFTLSCLVPLRRKKKKLLPWHCCLTLKNYRTPKGQTGRPRTRSCGIRRQSEIHLWEVHKFRSASSGKYISFAFSLRRPVCPAYQSFLRAN